MELTARASYAARATAAIVRDPHEGIDRVRERLAERRDLRTPVPRYGATPDWEARLHAALGVPWPCSMADEFEPLWDRVTTALRERGLRLGPGAFGGWNDGDPSFARAAWCIVSHLRPQRVVETGVARGLTSRCMLEGLIRSGQGHLWSIDLAPLIDLDLAEETGAAVDERCRVAWTFIAGSSRRCLPALVDDLGTVEFFVHDSMHTARNLRFELDRIWPALPAGGFVLVDDVDYNRVVHDWSQRAGQDPWLVAPHADGVGFFAIARKD